MSCKQELEPLPILGNIDVVDGDTLYHTIPNFKFIDQDSQVVTNEDLDPYIYVSDFFFMSCPSICPKVKKQMLRVYDKFENEPLIKIVSHTIDPKRDTPEKLKEYSKNLEVDNAKWMFLTGDKDDIFEIAEDYFVAAFEDPDAPGGFDHSGMIILVDKSRHVRAFALGTEAEDVDEFMIKIQQLLDEYHSKV